MEFFSTPTGFALAAGVQIAALSAAGLAAGWYGLPEWASHAIRRGFYGIGSFADELISFPPLPGTVELNPGPNLGHEVKVLPFDPPPNTGSSDVVSPNFNWQKVGNVDEYVSVLPGWTNDWWDVRWNQFLPSGYQFSRANTYASPEGFGVEFILQHSPQSSESVKFPEDYNFDFRALSAPFESGFSSGSRYSLKTRARILNYLRRLDKTSGSRNSRKRKRFAAQQWVVEPNPGPPPKKRATRTAKRENKKARKNARKAEKGNLGSSTNSAVRRAVMPSNLNPSYSVPKGSLIKISGLPKPIGDRQPGIRLMGRQIMANLQGSGAADTALFVVITGGATVANGNKIRVSPNMLNGRVAKIAGLYQYYAIRRFRVFFLPRVASTVAGTYSWGLSTDPESDVLTTYDFVNTSQLEVSCVSQFREPCELNYVYDGPRTWYIEDALASTADVRFGEQLTLLGFRDEATIDSTRWGIIYCEYVLDLYDPSPDYAIGLSTAHSYRRITADESSYLESCLDGHRRAKASLPQPVLWDSSKGQSQGYSTLPSALNPCFVLGQGEDEKAMI